MGTQSLSCPFTYVLRRFSSPSILCLDLHLLAIRFSLRNRLARLLNLLQYRLVAHVVRVDIRRFILKADVIGGEACFSEYR